MDYRKMERMLEAFTNQQSEYLQLEPILADVSKTGVVRFPWKLIQPLLRYRMKSVLDEAYGGVKNIPDDDKDLSRQLLERFDRFKDPPFTIQRLSELLMEPKRWYKRRSPFLRGIEKTLLVVSTVEADLSWMSAEQPVVSDEGKERLMSREELACTEDMISKSEEHSGVVPVSASNKRPLVELSEADSTVTNGFDAAESQQQNDGVPPSKKQCYSDDETSDNHPSNDASSTTSSPHEILHED